VRLGTLMPTSDRFIVFQVEATGGPQPVQQPEELSGKTSPGKRRVPPMGTERKARPCKWHQGAPLSPA